ncbi:hypothetical protein M413DRAFT_284473 [Hebeloma cylindrosporum]|uniref:Uncharacterized protein n=1 Tax=Hebeloma cylindrosporum TaxID=76867 RepID=A0A0C2Y6X4_HEBCY|nr:hypothetical protein M413DRAFT_284473 [Hebeloma cylindrosporum h7]
MSSRPAAEGCAYLLTPGAFAVTVTFENIRGLDQCLVRLALYLIWVSERSCQCL